MKSLVKFLMYPARFFNMQIEAILICIWQVLNVFLSPLVTHGHQRVVPLGSAAIKGGGNLSDSVVLISDTSNFDPYYTRIEHQIIASWRLTLKESICIFAIPKKHQNIFRFIKQIQKIREDSVVRAFFVEWGAPGIIRSLILNYVCHRYSIALIIQLPFGFEKLESLRAQLALLGLRGAFLGYCIAPRTNKYFKTLSPRVTVIGPHFPPTYLEDKTGKRIDYPDFRNFESRTIDIGMCGTLHPKREALLRHLVQEGFNVTYAGGDMNRLVQDNLLCKVVWKVPNSSSSSTSKSYLQPAEYWQFLQSCKIVINSGALEEVPVERRWLNRCPSKVFKGRVLETAVAGAVNVVDEFRQTSRLFMPNLEFIYYSGVNQLESEVSALLSDEQLAETVGHAGWEKGKLYYGNNVWKGVLPHELTVFDQDTDLVTTKSQEG